MEQAKAKFRLSTRIEEYYFEESVNEEQSDNDSLENDCSSIFKVFHQRALKSSRQAELKRNVMNNYENIFNQHNDYNYLEYTNDDSTHYSNQSAELRNSTSLNEKKYDLIHNRINYFRPTEPHKQRQSDILPYDRYERIMKDSPFDSPIDSAQRSDMHSKYATMHPAFQFRTAPQLINQSTQTSYNNSRQHVLADQIDSIYGQEPMISQHLINQSVAKSMNGSSNRFTTQEINSINEPINKSADKQMNRSTSKSMHNLTNKSSIDKSVNKSRSIAASIIENRTLKNLSTHSSKKSMINTTKSIKENSSKSQKSLNQNAINKSKLKDVSNVTKEKSKLNEIKNAKKRRSKYDISFSQAHIYEPDDESTKKHAQTELIESLLNSSTFKDLNLESFINSKKSTANSTKFSKKEQTKNFSGSFKDQATMNKTAKSNSTNLTKNNNSTAKNSAKTIKNSIRNETELRESTLKQPIQQVNANLICNLEDDKNEDLSDVSLILNSTCSQEELSDKNEKSKSESKLEELDNDLDISVIDFNTSMQNDVEVVFDEESILEQDSKSLSKFNEEIELCRKSVSHLSSPQISAIASLSETLSQPESVQQTTSNDNQPAQLKQTDDEQQLSIEFNSEDEESPVKSNPIDRKSISNPSIKSTPKSILKNPSAKRVWENASDFSLVNLTIESSNKSNSSHRKSNSVRFSDNVSEKFTSNLISLKKTPSPVKSLDQVIDRSISQSISKRIDEVIANESEHSLPSLDDSYDDDKEMNDSLTEKSSETKSTELEESEEDSLIVTINEISQSLEDIEEEDEEDQLSNKSEIKSQYTADDRTPENSPEKHQSTFTVKSLKKAPPKKAKRKLIVNKKQLPKYYETYVEKTPTIIYPNQQEEDAVENIRRSSRIRVRPLDFWRNQQPNYRRDEATKCLTIDGIEKGFKPDNPFFNKKRLNVNRAKKTNKKRKRQSSVDEEDDKEEEVVVKRARYAVNGEVSIHQPLSESAIELSEKIKKEAAEYCSHNGLSWTESKQSKGVHVAFMSRTKDKNSKTQATGFMKLQPQFQKPPQKTGNYVTNYVVMFGACSVKVGDKKNDKLDNKPAVILKSMDGFTVNDNTFFSINNLRNDELLLYFNLTKL